MLFIELPLAFHLYLIPRGLAVLDATSCIEIGVDELTGIAWGLIDLLIDITVAVPASLGAQRALILA